MPVLALKVTEAKGNKFNLIALPTLFPPYLRQLLAYLPPNFVQKTMGSTRQFTSDEIRAYSSKIVDFSLSVSPGNLMNLFVNYPGKLIIIGGRPAMGKTALMLSMIKRCQEYPSLIFSLGESAKQLTDKFNNISKDQPEFYICDSREIDFDQISLTIKYQQITSPVKIVFIDYLQLLPYPDTDLLNRLKQLAKEFEVPIVVFSQLNKSVNDYPLNSPALNSFPPRRLDVSVADEIYYLVRPDFYSIQKNVDGDFLKVLAILQGLKGTYQGFSFVMEFDSKNKEFYGF